MKKKCRKKTTRDELKKDVKLAWTDKTKAEIAAAKGTSDSGSENDNVNNNNGGTTNGGGDNGGGDNLGQN